MNNNNNNNREGKRDQIKYRNQKSEIKVIEKK
jgi:hypothetical protein